MLNAAIMEKLFNVTMLFGQSAHGKLLAKLMHQNVYMRKLLQSCFSPVLGNIFRSGRKLNKLGLDGRRTERCRVRRSFLDDDWSHFFRLLTAIVEVIKPLLVLALIDPAGDAELGTPVVLDLHLGASFVARHGDGCWCWRWSVVDNRRNGLDCGRSKRQQNKASKPPKHRCCFDTTGSSDNQSSEQSHQAIHHVLREHSPHAAIVAAIVNLCVLLYLFVRSCVEGIDFVSSRHDYVSIHTKFVTTKTQLGLLESTQKPKVKIWSSCGFRGISNKIKDLL